MKQLLIAIAMVMVPVMGAGGEGIKGLRPSLEVKLVAEWRHAGKKKGFVSFGGGSFSPGDDLPKGTDIRPMVPNLAKADRALLSADEANLARYVQIVFPKGTSVEPYLAVIRQWQCVEEVQRPPEVSLP